MREPPGIAYFKMKEAHALQGQFDRWDEGRRNKLLLKLIDIVGRHAVAGMGSVVPQAAYRDVFQGRVAPATDSPYFFNFYAVMSVWAVIQRRAGDTRAADFIFDERGREIVVR